MSREVLESKERSVCKEVGKKQNKNRTKFALTD